MHPSSIGAVISQQQLFESAQHVGEITAAHTIGSNSSLSFILSRLNNCSSPVHNWKIDQFCTPVGSAGRNDVMMSLEVEVECIK